MAQQSEVLGDDCVLIVGGGPVGLLLAQVLKHYEVKSTILEKNLSTTKWPKMDLTNARSMELLRTIGLDQVVRDNGVPSQYSYNVVFSPGLNAEAPLSQWELPSVDRYKEDIEVCNDGTLPSQSYQRISQALFEAVLKERSEGDKWTDLRFGWKVESVTESDGRVIVEAVDVKSSVRQKISAKYLVGCDGASSIVRQSLGIALTGGPVPVHAILVHFRSSDLDRIQRHGQFWHLFTVNDTGAIGGAVIAQDEKEIWTVHLFAPLEFDGTELSSEDIVARVLGGATGPFTIKIDEVLVRSTYRPHIAVAERYMSNSGRIVLAGDAAHQNVPTGGYGMNMGIGDVFNLGWKIAAILRGFGGPILLRSYEEERKPVATMSIDRSGAHLAVHMQLASILAGNALATEAKTKEALLLRQRIDDYFQEHDGENKDLGVEMGYQYRSSICSFEINEEPLAFDPRKYQPSTSPGMRVPYVKLSDGQSLYDKFGPWFTAVSFSKALDAEMSKSLLTAERLAIPFKHLDLSNEVAARVLWETNIVIVRPDHHVAWRGDELLSERDMEVVLNVIIGRTA